MFETILENVRNQSPLVHTITNNVTANDCANILLAIGASPIMAEDPREVEEITALASGLCLNIGTISEKKGEAMLLAGKRAAALGHPVVLDPVGAGASRLRTQTAQNILREVPCAVIRGNASEIRTLFQGNLPSRGVDSAQRITEDALEETIALAKAFAKQAGAVVAITGNIDIVADPNTAYCIRNGHPMMGRVTGCGCQLSALTAAFAAANPSNLLLAAAAAVCAMGVAGEIAHKRLAPLDGNATYRNYIIDAIYNLTSAQLEEGANYEVR